MSIGWYSYFQKWAYFASEFTLEASSLLSLGVSATDILYVTVPVVYAEFWGQSVNWISKIS